jgi:hypothetical protein
VPKRCRGGNSIKTKQRRNLHSLWDGLLGKEILMTKKKRKRHTPEQIVKKLRDAGSMLNAGQKLGAVLQSLGVSEATYHPWQKQYGGMQARLPKQPLPRSDLSMVLGLLY